MSAEPTAGGPPPAAAGYYVATYLPNNLQIGYDQFAVRDDGDGGIVVESKHVIFGANVPTQTARFALDPDWTPRRLDITAEGVMSASVEFGDAEATIRITAPQGERQIRAPVGRHRAYFMMSGGLYFPVHIVRRFRFDDPAPQLFHVVPDGLCEARRGADVEEDGQALRQIDLRFQVAGTEDFVTLLVNERGDLVRYQTRNQNLLVKLEERE